MVDALMIAEKMHRFHRQAVAALTLLRKQDDPWTTRAWRSVSARDISEFYQRRLEGSPDSLPWFVGLAETIESLAFVDEDITLIHCCREAASVVLIIGENSGQPVGLIVFDPLPRDFPRPS